MLTNKIKNVKEFKLLKDNNYLNATTLLPEFIKLIENSYFAPSYIVADTVQVNKIKEGGYWLELKYESRETFKGYSFDTLLIPIKPKCDWLTLYRGNENNFNGKCLNLNLSIKTTDFYKLLKDFKGDNNEA